MRTRSSMLASVIVVAPMFFAACGSSDDDGGTADQDTGIADSGALPIDSGIRDTNTGSDADGGTSDTGAGDVGDGAASDGDTSTASAKFKIRIENVSGSSARPTPISPGVWALHGASESLFTAGAKDRGEGLEHIAEDGDPTVLAASLKAKSSIAASGVFDTAVSATAAGPAAPGSAFEFEITASPSAGQLSFAQMFGQSSDVFIGPDGSGIALFDSAGKPLAAHDVSASISLWDAGTERNQPPGLGPDQAPRQAAPNTGASEIGVARFTSGTRGLPIGKGIVDVTVTATGSTYTLKIANVSASKGAYDTPISPIFYATHAASFSLFTLGSSARGTGLESLAEDGSPAKLVTTLTGATGVGVASAIARADGASADGPAPSGGSFTFSVTPDAAHPRLAFAMMAGQSNDAFVALAPEGVALLDASGVARSAADVQSDIMRLVALWDAGTEKNEVPGVGPNQAPRQLAPNTGADDPTNMVRLYDDATNDLLGAGLGGFASVTIVAGATSGSFDVTVMNTSGSTVYPGNVSPVAWATHDTTASLFTVGAQASAGIEAIAEDGNAEVLRAALPTIPGVLSSGVANAPDGVGVGPAGPGKSFHFTVTPDATHRFLSIAAMVAPSNDTFLGFDPAGVALLDASGAPRTNTAIAADVAAHLFAWDAGTEENQAGAQGPDQASHQIAPNTGANEGDSTVRKTADPVWSFPLAKDVVKVTITPMP